MKWWRVLATADEEPDRAVILQRFRTLLKPQAQVIDHTTKKVYSFERFKERMRKQA